MQPNRTRNRTLNFRCTEEEYQFISSKIAASGRTKTDFLIETLQEKEIVIYTDLTATLTELKRQGINLNQALRYAHNEYKRWQEKERGYPHLEIAELRETIKNCNQLYLQYLNLWQESNGKESSQTSEP